MFLDPFSSPALAISLPYTLGMFLKYQMVHRPLQSLPYTLGMFPTKKQINWVRAALPYTLGMFLFPRVH